jgi:hypothetical protein
VALWTFGGLNFATNLAPIIKDQGYDTIPIWRAVHALLTNSQIYTERGAGDFLYLPSSLLMLLPLGALDLSVAKALLFFTNIAAILLSTALLLRVFGFRVVGLAGAIALCGLSFAWPVFFTLGAGNIDSLVLLGFVLSLIAAENGSWTAAGIFFGLSIALKPVLVPALGRLRPVPPLARPGGCCARSVLPVGDRRARGTGVAGVLQPRPATPLARAEPRDPARQHLLEKHR